MRNIEELQEWLPIDGYNGKYEVSPKGLVRSNSVKYKGKIMAGWVNHLGYYVVLLTKSGGIGKTERVHRLVAKHFIPNPEQKKEVNHKNGIKTDNTVDNLEWVTPKENARHSWDMGFNKGRTGLKSTDEHRAKISAANSGKKRSPEYVAKMAERVRQWWADKKMKEAI